MQIINEINEEKLIEIYKISVEQFKDESWSINQFNESLNSPNSFYLALEEKNKILSFLLYQDTLDSINILLIATKEEAKRKGYAKNLIEYLENFTNKKIWLEVKETNQIAIKFYENCGFKPIYVRKKYYKTGENAIILEKN